MPMTYHNDGTYTSGDSVENIELRGKATKSAKRIADAPPRRSQKKSVGAASAGFDLNKLKSNVKSGSKSTDSAGSTESQTAKDAPGKEEKKSEASSASTPPAMAVKKAEAKVESSEQGTALDTSKDSATPKAKIVNTSTVETPEAADTIMTEPTESVSPGTEGSSTEMSNTAVSEMTLDSTETVEKESSSQEVVAPATSESSFTIVSLEELLSGSGESINGAIPWIKRACNKSVSAADTVFAHNSFKVYAVRFIRDSAIALIGTGDKVAAAEYSYSKDHLADATSMLSTKGAFVCLSNTPIITAEYKTRPTREV